MATAVFHSGGAAGFHETIRANGTIRYILYPIGPLPKFCP
jgi:hypothetical protein